MTVKVLQFPAPHRINAFRGATAADVAKTRAQVDLCFDLFMSALTGHLGNLKENLVGANLPKLIYEMHLIAEARHGIIDVLDDLADRAAEDAP